MDITTLREQYKGLFEETAEVDTSKPKFFIIWAYLTVSGFHHVGHMRGFSYADAIARFKRLQGYNVLLTAGGHASGNSALAKAKKVREGDQAVIQDYKKGGLTDEDIKSLETPEGFVKTFSKRYIDDYKDYGFLGDWSRFTVTTNDDYKKFIQWQFKTLKDKGLLIQKPYFGTWSPQSGPVAVDPSESDLSKGGNAEKNDYTVIKLRLTKAKSDVLQQFPNLFAVTATLRPETMIGQTNIWMNPEVSYVVVSVAPNSTIPQLIEKEHWLVSQECAEKLQHQYDSVSVVQSVDPKTIIGGYVHAPVLEKEIPIFPASFVHPDRGTGVVTSVPSDAPFDYVAHQDLQRNTQLREQFAITDEMLTRAQPIPIARTEGYSTIPSKDLVKKYNITSLQDHESIELATKEIYKKQHHNSVLTSGPYKDMQSKLAKDKARQDLIESNKAFVMYDLSEEVICRMGGKVIMKRFDDQWFIKYSDEELTEQTKQLVQGMKIFPESFQKNLPNVLDWFDDRACARQGNWLGTPLPFDENYIVEPISDSTLYPIYYLVSKYVNEGKVHIDQLTSEFFDFVFLQEGDKSTLAQSTGITEDLLQQIQNDVAYWYPLDINLGGKEHQTVHFPVFLMNHRALLPDSMQPKGILVNWWVTGKDGKFSKSKGNLKSIQDEANTYSADAIRLYYANIANPFVDIVFDPDMLGQAKNRLEKIIAEVTDSLASNSENPTLDAWFRLRIDKKINAVVDAMNRFELKEASDIIYFQWLKDWQWYCKRGGSNAQLLKSIASDWAVCMSMFTPFVAENIATHIGMDGHAFKQPLAARDVIDDASEELEQVVQKTLHDIKDIAQLAKLEKVTKITVIIADQWKYDLRNDLSSMLSPDAQIGQLMQELTGKYPEHKKQVSGVIQKAFKKRNIDSTLASASAELATFTDALRLFAEQYGCEVSIIEEAHSDHPKAQQAQPLKPAIVLE